MNATNLDHAGGLDTDLSPFKTPSSGWEHPFAVMHCTARARVEYALRPEKPKTRVPSGVAEQHCRVFPTTPHGQQPASSVSWEAGPGKGQRGQGSFPSCHGAAARPLCRNRFPRTSKAQRQRWLLAHHRGEDAGNALASILHLLLLARHLLPHLPPANITQQAPFAGRWDLCPATFSKEEGCCKGCTCGGNSKAIYRGSASKPRAGVHPQPHTTLAGVRDTFLKRGSEMPGTALAPFPHQP